MKPSEKMQYDSDSIHTNYLGFRTLSSRDKTPDLDISQPEGLSLFQFPTKNYHKK